MPGEGNTRQLSERLWTLEASTSAGKNLDRRAEEALLLSSPSEGGHLEDVRFSAIEEEAANSLRGALIANELTNAEESVLIGELAFELTGIEEGSLQHVRIELGGDGLNNPQILKPTDAGGWDLYTYDPLTGTGAQFIDADANGLFEAVDLWIQDGGRGDLDGTANGVIVDPAVIASLPSESSLNADKGLRIDSWRYLPHGLGLRLSEAPDLDVFNLYDGPEDVAVNQPDLTLTGPNGESVALSAHWQASSNELLLLSSDPLAAGDYTLTIDSRSDGLISASSGELLDGNGDGTPGDPFAFSFSHTTPEHLLSVADTARGAGQQLSLNGSGTHDPLTGAPLADSTGLPIHLSTSSSLTSFSGSLSYDQQLLLTPELNTEPPQVLRAGSDLLDDWTLSIDPSSQPGELFYSASGSTAITGSNLEILRFQATISSIAAPPEQGSSGNGLYGATTLIQTTFSSDQLPTDPLTGTPLEIDTDPGLIALAYAGDTTGDGSLSSLDASRVQRVVVGLESGFDAYDTINPVLIGDTTGNGTLSSLDASRIQQQVVGLEVDSFPDFTYPYQT